MMLFRVSLLASLAVLLTVAPSSVGAEPQSSALLDTAAFDFGRVPRGAIVEHAFRIRNDGSGPLRVLRASMTPPLAATALPTVVPPGQEASLRFRLDTGSLQGLFEGAILVALEGSSPSTVQLTFQGFVVPPVELVPGPTFFVSAQRGTVRQQSIEVVNHETTPLRIHGIAHASAVFDAVLETLEPGRHYRLTVSTKPQAPLGRHTEGIVLHTSSTISPRLGLRVNTFVHERIYAFPDTVDLGGLPLGRLQATPGLRAALTQQLVVHSPGNSDLMVTVNTDLPMLALAPARAQTGDRWQIAIALDPDRVVGPGPIRGHITIDTNDPELSRLVVPVTGTILP